MAIILVGLHNYISQSDISCPASMALRMMVDEISTISASRRVILYDESSDSKSVFIDSRSKPVRGKTAVPYSFRMRL